MSTSNSSYPQGAFSFEQWFKESVYAHFWPVAWQEQVLSKADLEAAFQAGYVSAVRHHDSAMRRLIDEANSLEF